VSCEGPLRLDLGSAEVIDAQVNNETRFWGTNKRRALYRKTCAIDRQVDVLNDYEAADSVIIGQRSMYFDDLGACRGLYAGLDPAHAIESKSDFALEYVKELGVDYRCIDETKWPQDLRLWAENFERIMAFDDRVLMYVQEAGTHRIIFEKTGDPSRDTLFDQELKKLYEAVSPRFLRHPPTRQAVLEMFEMDGDAIEQATRQINEERACREESSDIAADYPDRAPHRVWIPRR
jgi:hypothetical protein